MQLVKLTLLTVIAACSLLAEAEGRLRVLAWPGYADPDVVSAFEQQTGAKVDVTFVDTDDALWEKVRLHDGQDFDVVAVNTAELQRLIDFELVQALPLAQIPNIQQQLKRFHQVKGISRAGSRYAVPFTFSEMGLIYNKRLISTPPTSMAALWDKQYQGRIALHEGSPHNFSLTALVMGTGNPFQISQAQFPRVVNRLVALRANRPHFYSSPDDAVTLFRNHDIALMFGNFGSQQVRLLKKAGFDVGYVIPKEGALAWLDCWAMLRGASDRNLAAAWINHMSSVEVGHILTERQGLANTQEPWPGIRDKDRIVWLQPVENSEQRNRYWARILSGSRKGMF
ncbi:extracellular solute-binding protein [Chitinimonas sp. BJYL2]|uniref:extracellular solute-binding protein n=1 Tax=Chitinimonas sp. BJYL2 TaxID=2976696 RepID=UPI0022B3DE51|nr:extracellular solute-binding protein [Chitinimonas sp. BJYL2]